MEKDDLIDKLEAEGFELVKHSRTGNNDGWRLDLDSGAIVNLYDSGRPLVQGKNQPPVQALVNKIMVRGGSLSAAHEVLVVGRKGKARDRLGRMLKRWRLKPLMVDNLNCKGETIVEQLRRLRYQVGFGVVLANPADVGHRKNKPERKALRARQHVVLELGMLLALLGRSKVVVLVKKGVRMELPSDIPGVRYVKYKGRASPMPNRHWPRQCGRKAFRSRTTGGDAPVRQNVLRKYRANEIRTRGALESRWLVIMSARS